MTDLFFYGGTGTVVPPEDRTIVMVGAGQLAQAGGPLVTRPGEVIPEMAVYLFHRPALSTVVTQLDYVLSPTFQDRLKELGTASVELLNDDPDLALVWDHDCALRFEVYGRAVFTALVDEIEHVAIAEGEEHDQRTTLRGRAHIGSLQEAVVYPSAGVDHKPYADKRRFDWTSMEFWDAHWPMSNGIAAFSDNSYWTNANIKGWPDPGAVWMWAPGSNDEWAPSGPCYFRAAVDVPEGVTELVCYACFDDVGSVYIDGEPLLEGEFGMNPMVTGNPSDSMDVYEGSRDVTPGLHIVAIRCDNGIDIEGDQTQNPGGVLFTCYGTAGNDSERTGPLMHSDNNWACLPYPPTEPGMTPGEVIRQAVTEAQRTYQFGHMPPRGAIPEVRLGFDDHYDSAGTPWPVTTGISTDIGTNYWTFICEEMASTYVDVWMAPGDFTLYAWIKGGRGKQLALALTPPVNELDPDQGNLRGLTHHTVR